MSTKSTITYGEAFHLYNELMDRDDDVWLQLTGAEFEATPHGVTVRIPIHVWEHIRHYGGFKPQYHAMDDQALLAHVTQEVDERIKEWTAGGGSGLIEFAGSFAYGLASEPREQQIRQGFDYLAKRRADEQEIVQRINALKDKFQQTMEDVEPPQADD